jgi:hypothetical protein
MNEFWQENRKSTVYCAFTTSNAKISHIILAHRSRVRKRPISVSHAAFVYFCPNREAWLIEGANWRGWYPQHLTDWETDGTGNKLVRVYRTELDLWRGLADPRIKQMLGRAYPKVELLGAALVPFFRRNLFNDPALNFCSEGMADVIMASGGGLKLPYAASGAAPDEVEDALVEMRGVDLVPQTIFAGWPTEETF